MSNLLHNAVRYGAAGGHVTVCVARDGQSARLAVLDDGPGIPAQERARAGERFFRASNTSRSGSGLGLAVVSSIAERHGGRMTVDAGADGRGLEVALLLPLAADRPAHRR